MKHLVPPEQPSESMLVGCLLAASGGFQDAYTYNVRDQVFANAQTGNMVFSRPESGAGAVGNGVGAF